MKLRCFAAVNESTSLGFFGPLSWCRLPLYKTLDTALEVKERSEWSAMAARGACVAGYLKSSGCLSPFS